MPRGCLDGLGGEEVGAVSSEDGINTTGSITAAGLDSTAGVSATGSVYATTNVEANTGSIVAGTSAHIGTSIHIGTSAYIPAGSQTGIVQPYAAASAVSGGDIVMMSGGEVLVTGVLEASAYGVCIDTTPVDSGGTANVLVRGVYDFKIATAVNAGSFCMVGSAANTVMQADTFEKTFGKVIQGGASGGTALVLF